MESSDLYKFLSFEKFVDMIQSQSLYFVNPSLWEDPRELWGVECFIAKTPAGETKNFLICARAKHFAQSWTEIDESDSMWRIYAKKTSDVRISISKQNLEKISNVAYRKIIYRRDIKKYVEKLKNNTEGLEKAFCVKTTFFEHEKEVRLIYQEPQDIDPTAAILRSLPDLIKQRTIHANRDLARRQIFDTAGFGQNQPRSKKISFAHVENFIKSVMASPFAKDWEVEMLKTYCQERGLNFLGKSKHYTMD